MFDIKATQAWWNFFHRFSLIYEGTNFNQIVLLAVNLLECENCMNDAMEFFPSIGSHKSNFEKIHILHNYVNRKLGKKIFDITETQYICNDIFDSDNTTINWERMLKYYYDLLFAITGYLEIKQLDDLKTFSALVYQGLSIPRKVPNLYINTKSNEAFNRELLQLQVYEYYHKLLSSVNLENKVRSFPQVYGKAPRKTKTCKSCAKRHQMYLERHNKAEPTPTKTISMIRQNPTFNQTSIANNNVKRAPVNKIDPATIIKTANRMPITTDKKPPLVISHKKHISNKNPTSIKISKPSVPNNVSKSINNITTKSKSNIRKPPSTNILSSTIKKPKNIQPKQMKNVKTLNNINKKKKPSTIVPSSNKSNPYKNLVKFAPSKIIRNRNKQKIKKK